MEHEGYWLDPLGSSREATRDLPGAAARPLFERLAAAPPEARGALLVAALAAGESIDLPHTDLRDIDLRPGRPARGLSPTDPDLRPTVVVLDGANLEGAMLSGACLAGVSLRGARLGGALLVGADLTGADLSGASLRSANLTGARLTRADLSFADLRGASLLTAQLTEATAVAVDLRDALVQSATLTRAVLRASDLRWARLTGANLSSTDVRDARFEGAILAMANFADARLSAATDFSLAFLFQARFDRTGLSRRHVAGGIGEAHTDLALARDTYRGLARYFALGGMPADARWAHQQASRMATATHRVDRARRYHGGPRPAGGLARVWFHARHGVQWALGHAADVGSGYGTCFARLVGTLLAVWLTFAAFFHRMGALIDHGGRPVTWLDSLHYSAAALTPVDAYPLVATSDVAGLAATLEGLAGMALLGALGFVAASRVRRE